MKQPTYPADGEERESVKTLLDTTGRCDVAVVWNARPQKTLDDLPKIFASLSSDVWRLASHVKTLCVKERPPDGNNGMTAVEIYFVTEFTLNSDPPKPEL